MASQEPNTAESGWRQNLNDGMAIVGLVIKRVFLWLAWSVVVWGIIISVFVVILTVLLAVILLKQLSPTRTISVCENHQDPADVLRCEKNMKYLLDASILRHDDNHKTEIIIIDFRLINIARNEFNNIVNGLQSEISAIALIQNELLFSQKNLYARITAVDSTNTEQNAIVSDRINTLEISNQNNIASVYSSIAEDKLVLENAVRDIENKIHSTENAIRNIYETILEAKQHVSDLKSALENADISSKVLHGNTFDKGSMTAVILTIIICQAGLILVLCTSWNPYKLNHAREAHKILNTVTDRPLHAWLIRLRHHFLVQWLDAAWNEILTHVSLTLFRLKRR